MPGAASEQRSKYELASAREGASLSRLREQLERLEEVL